MSLTISSGEELVELPGIFDCEVVSQGRVMDGIFCIMLNCPTIAKCVLPGQFVNVRVLDGAEPLLRRPFSVHGVNPGMGAFSLIYAVRGKGTELLAKKRRSDIVSVVGPLGKPFVLGDNPEARHVIVCGGCGTAPMVFLGEMLSKKWGADKVTALLGAKNNDAVLGSVDFQNYGAKVSVATDDGSYGHHGFVTELLSERLALPADGTRVYACGPREMLKEVARISKQAEVASCQVSLENHMACGLGLCLGCVQKHVQPEGKPEGWDYLRVCTDGPVFEAEAVIWE